MNDPAAIDSLLESLPDVLTTEDVAEMMRVESQTVRKWIQHYGLRAISVGPRIKRIRKADLRDFLLTSDDLS